MIGGVSCAVAVDIKDGRVRTQNFISGMKGQETIGKFKTVEEAKKYYEKAGFNVYCDRTKCGSKK